MPDVTISVIIPVRNGAATLGRCLGALARSKRPAWECIVVDDGSTDNSSAIARSFGVHVIRDEKGSGPARARNLGVSEASGDILLFIDADVCVNEETVGRVQDHFESNPKLDALMGSYDDAPDDQGLISQYKNLLHHYVHQRGKREAATFWTGCGAVRREVFAAVSGFNENFERPTIEDIEFGYRLRQAGYRILLDPTVQVKHLKKYNLMSWLKSDIFDRALPWTRLIVNTGKAPNDLNLGGSQRASAALVLSSLALGPACLTLGAPIEIAFVPLAASIVLNRDFYRFLAAKNGWRLAASAIAMHSAYYAYSSLAFVAGTILYGPLGDQRPLGSSPGKHAKAPVMIGAPVIIDFEQKVK